MSTIEPPAAVPDTRASDASDGTEIRLLDRAEQMVEVVDVLRHVWGSQTELVRLEMLMAISHSGGYVSGAYDVSGDEDRILGASVAILARHRGAPALHSHITGIRPEVRATGLGRAMKRHQQAWARERGLDTIVWTFDPLVRRNAWFNIAVLGVEVHAYLPSFYGTMTDAINAGDESDRLLVVWDVHADTEGELRDGTGVTDPVLIPTPDDIVALRRSDPAGVARLRRESREAFERAFARGGRVVGFTRDGSYVVTSS